MTAIVATFSAALVNIVLCFRFRGVFPLVRSAALCTPSNMHRHLFSCRRNAAPVPRHGPFALQEVERILGGEIEYARQAQLEAQRAWATPPK